MNLPTVNPCGRHRIDGTPPFGTDQRAVARMAAERTVLANVDRPAHFEKPSTP